MKKKMGAPASSLIEPRHKEDKGLDVSPYPSVSLSTRDRLDDPFLIISSTGINVVEPAQYIRIEMVLENKITSPHRRQNPLRSPSFRRLPSARGDELGSYSMLVHRHRFLLTAIALLTILCTIYLYFAISLGDDDSCSALTGTEKALCRIEQAKESVHEGKIKFF